MAIYSDCERYRYSLHRVWDPSGRLVNFIMLNPSTATEIQNDPTVERCERRARTLGFGAFSVTNIFAWRDTDPKAMRAADDPIGPHNDQAIRDCAKSADFVIAAWGTHGAHLNRGPSVADALADCGQLVHHFGLSKHGHPKHPLYLSYNTQPKVWNLAPGAALG